MHAPRRPMIRLATYCLLVALPVWGAPLTEPLGGPHRHHAHVGAVAMTDLGHAEAVWRDLYRQRDRTGRRGAGTVVTYRSSDRRARAQGGRGVRLFNTGVLGIEPTLGILPDGTVVTQGQRRGSISLESVVIASRNGRRWRDVSPRSSSGNQHEHSYTQDPYLTVDGDTGRIFTSDLLFPAPGQMLSYSDDAGESWTTTIMSVEQTDHQTVFVGPPSPADEPTGYANVVYDCAANVFATAVASSATTCVKSLDGGSTWRLTGAPPFVNDPTAGPGTLEVPGQCSGLTGHGHVGRDGPVYLPRGWCGQPWLAISDDGGTIWDLVQVSDIGMAAGDTGPPDNLPQPSHEAGVVSDRAGNLYYTWVAADLLPYLATSTDGGSTWSEPMRLSPPGVTQTSIPTIAIAPQAPVGKIALAYMGSTDAPGAPYQIAETAYEGATWNAYVTVLRDGLAGDPVVATATISDPADPLWVGKCGTLRCGAQYEFIDVQVSRAGVPWVAAVDACFQGACLAVGGLVVARLTGVALR